MAKKVTVFSTSACPYCVMVKKFLEEKDVDFEVKDVGSDEKAREEMLKKTGQMGVPVIDVDGEIIIGFNKKKLSELLDLE